MTESKPLPKLGLPGVNIPREELEKFLKKPEVQAELIHLKYEALRELLGDVALEERKKRGGVKMTLRVGAAGRVVLPANIRRDFVIREGDYVTIELLDVKRVEPGYGLLEKFKERQEEGEKDAE